MKKLFLIVSLFFSFYISFAQPVVNRSPKTVTVADSRMKTYLNLILPTYTDTSSNVGGANHTDAIGVDSCGAFIFTYSDNAMWIRKCNPKRWGFVGNVSGVDTIYVENPIAIKIGTSGASTGKQVIYFLKESGLIAGGIPYSTGCRTLTMPPSIYNINFNQYSSLSTNLTIDTSHATLNRTDRIVGDTFGVISVLKGTNSVLGLPPPFNPSSQFSLALISIPAAAGCTPATGKIVYDQAVGVAGGEYDTSRTGLIAVDYNNTDNPYHLTKAAFISTYRDSTQLVFTNTGLQDTVTSTSALVLPTYLNNQLTNPIQVEFFLGSTSVSNNTVVNSFLNTSDTGQYQVAVIPFTAFGFNSQYFNKIVFTFRGWDTSGAAGLYFDYIQIQKGFTFSNSNNYVDSVKVVAGNIYYYIKGIAYLSGASGSGFPIAGAGLSYNGDTLNANSNLQDGFIVRPDVIWLNNYDYTVTQGVYVIGNVTYTSPVTDVTLAASDPTNPRIDVFAVNTSSAVTVLTGTPSTPAVEPTTSATELEVSFANVAAGSTQPTVTNDWIYRENTGSPEWQGTPSAGTINVNSTNNPDLGTKDVEGTAVANGTYVQFVAPSTPNMGLYQYLVYRIRSKANWTTTRTWVLRFYNGTTAVGNPVTFGSGSNGFVSSNTTTYQTIVYALTAFGNISNANRFRITQTNSSGTVGWYLDNIQLQAAGGGGMPQQITLTGDATGTGTNTIPTTLATVNSNVGSFTNSNITVNAKGLITAASSGSATGNFKYNEQFTGSTSLTLTLSQTYTSGTVRLTKNGVRLFASDFTEAGATTLTLLVPRLSGDIFLVDFNY